MSEDSFAELQKLKNRLESLGVKIKGYPAGHASSKGSQKRDEDGVNRLLARCEHVEETLDSREPFRELGKKQENVAYRSPLTAERKGTKKAFVSTVQRSQKLGARPRTSPLSGLLADYREAEARWNRERADIRRQLAAEKKRSSKLDAQLKKLTSLHESRLVDVKAFKSALSNRDNQIKIGAQRAKHLEEEHARAAESMSQEMAAIARERDDLKELLTATLQRLETVDDVVRRAGMANAALEDQVQCLRCERDNAKEAAAAARERADTLLKSQRRIEWQNKMLDRISEVQLVHNRQKTVAMHDLLDRKGDQASTIGDTCTDEP